MYPTMTCKFAGVSRYFPIQTTTKPGARLTSRHHRNALNLHAKHAKVHVFGARTTVWQRARNGSLQRPISYSITRSGNPTVKQLGSRSARQGASLTSREAACSERNETPYPIGPKRIHSSFMAIYFVTANARRCAGRKT